MKKIPKSFILILFLFGLRLCFNKYGNINNDFGFNFFGAWLGVPTVGWAIWLYYDFYYKGE